MSTTNTNPLPGDDQAAEGPGLVRCKNCGRHGWHETARCPERHPRRSDAFRHHRDTARVVPATATGAADVRIDICTDEDSDGAERYITLNGQIHLLNPAAVRRVARELLGAADELEGAEQ